MIYTVSEIPLVVYYQCLYMLITLDRLLVGYQRVSTTTGSKWCQI